MQIELNDNEAQVLVNLLNVAVKAAGIEAAESALFFVKKIKDASAPPPPPVMEPTANGDE